MYNRFLANYQTGENDPRSLIGSFVVTWGIFFLLGSIPILIIVSWYVNIGQITFFEFLDDPNNLTGIPAIVIFIGAMGQFPVGFIGLWISNRLVLKRHMTSLVTASAGFRWNRLFKGILIWVGLLVGYGLLIWKKSPDILQYKPVWDSFFTFLPFALILVPIQCAFEEIAVRGQLMQNITGYFKEKTAPIVPLLISSVFFAFLHSLNPEVQTYGFAVMMVQYFSIGFIFGLYTLLDEGLELAIGMHIGNNLFSFFLVSYPGSVLQTPSLFVQILVEPWQDLLALLGMSIILYPVLYGWNPKKIKEIFRNRELT